MTLLAMWQRLSLAYRLKDERTEEFAITLYKALFKRKYLYEDASAEDQETFLKNEEQELLFDECRRYTDLIKLMTVCAIVMEVTRRLPVKDK